MSCCTCSEVSNIAPQEPPQSFNIIPSGAPSILLHGWLRAYAEFDVPCHVKGSLFKKASYTNRIRQELFEATDGQWLIVETYISSNVAEKNRLAYRQRSAWAFPDKASIKAPPLMNRTHVHALFQSCGIRYQQVVGQLTDKGTEND